MAKPFYSKGCAPSNLCRLVNQSILISIAPGDECAHYTFVVRKFEKPALRKHLDHYGAAHAVTTASCIVAVTSCKDAVATYVASVVSHK